MLLQGKGQENYFESDAMIEARKKRALKGKLLKNNGNPIQLPSKALATALHNGSLFVAESGFIVQEIDISQWKIKKTYKPGHTGPVTSIAIVVKPEGTFIITGSWDKTIRSTPLPADGDAGSNSEIGVFHGHTDFVKSLIYVKSRSWLISGSSDKTIKFWDLNDKERKPFKSLLVHTRGIESLALDDSEQFLFTCSSDSLIKKFHVETGELLMIFQHHETSVHQILLVEDALWSVSLDNTVKQVDVATGKVLTALSHPDWVKSIAFYQGLAVTCGRDEVIYVWDLKFKDEKIVKTIEGHSDQIDNLEVSYPFLFSASLDCTVRKWNVKDLLSEKSEKSEKESVPTPAIEVKITTEEEDRELEELMNE